MKEDLYYAAFLDAEGCFRFNTKSTGGYQGSPRISISNTYLPILQEYKEVFGGSIYKMYDAHDEIRTCYRWYVDGDNCRKLLRRVIPYLKEKQPQAVILLQISSVPTMYRGPFVEKLKELKRINY